MNPIDKRFTDELGKIPSVTKGVIAYIKAKQQRNKPKQMKPTPITDIQLKKLSKLSEEMDSLIQESKERPYTGSIRVLR